MVFYTIKIKNKYNTCILLLDSQNEIVIHFRKKYFIRQKTSRENDKLLLSHVKDDKQVH